MNLLKVFNGFANHFLKGGIGNGFWQNNYNVLGGWNA
jgi:hypothetical protein